MDGIVIKKHDFELAKKRLKEFSEKEEKELEINRVRTDGGLFGLGDHKVTGYELNNRIETIQNHLIDINTTNNKTIREFREVYNALDALDKDYMTSIIASVKAIEKTSNDVRTQQEVLKQHNDDLEKQQSKLNAHQGEIEKIVDDMKKAIGVLKKFNEKLNGLKHLTEIDQIWSECKTISTEVQAVSATLSKSIEEANRSSQENAKKVETVKTALTIAEGKIDDLFKQSSVLNENVESIIVFIKALEQITHLHDVDKMWESVDSVHNSIKQINGKVEEITKKQDVKFSELLQKTDRAFERIDSNENEINQLNEYKEKLSSFSHLEDIDEIWENQTEHTTQISNFEKQNQELVTTIQKNKEEVDAKVEGIIKEANNAVESLTKKIKYAYLVAGGAAGLAIIELILLLL